MYSYIRIFNTEGETYFNKENYSKIRDNNYEIKLQQLICYTRNKIFV